MEGVPRSFHFWFRHYATFVFYGRKHCTLRVDTGMTENNYVTERRCAVASVTLGD